MDDFDFGDDFNFDQPKPGKGNEKKNNSKPGDDFDFGDDDFNFDSPKKKQQID